MATTLKLNRLLSTRSTRLLLPLSHHSIPQRNYSQSTPHPDSCLKHAFDSPSPPPSPSVKTTGLFLQPSLTSPASFTPLALRTIDRAQFIVDRICSSSINNPNAIHPQSIEEAELLFLGMVKNLDRLSDLLCGVIDLCEVLRNVHPGEDWRDGVDEAYGVLYEFMNELNTHVGLYEALKSIHSILPASTPQKSTSLFAAYAVAIPFLRDFEKSGIHLPPSQRTKFVDLSTSILNFGRKFLQNTSDSADGGVLLSSGEVGDGLGENFRARVFGNEKEVRIDPSSWEGRILLRQHPSESVRRKVFIALNSPPESHVEVLEEMVKTRAELATLVGRETWGDVALEDKMAKNPENVKSFLGALNQHNLPRARKDLKILEKFKKEMGGTSRVEGWDRDFLADLASGSSTLSNIPDISPFFSVGTCFQGLSTLFTTLYGIRFEVSNVKPGEVWENSVKKLKVIDEDEGEIGEIYCDLFSRVGKNPGAAHYTVRCSRRVDDDDSDLDFTRFEDGRIVAMRDGIEIDRRELESLEVGTVSYKGREGRHQTPVIVLVCAFGNGERDGVDTMPAFLQWHEVETLFHEMGHAIHSMIGRTDYHNVAGTRCATDFVELPSILMEHFVSSPSVVSLFTSHVTTGRPLPTSILTSLLAERRQFSALETSTQISMAALDQAYHSTLPLSPTFSSTQVLKQIQNEFNVIPYAEGTAWQVQFGHLFGYGATYYSYLFDRAIAARVFKRRFEKDPLSRESGEGFKIMLLRWGGGKEPWEMVGEVVESEVVARGGKRAMEEVGKWGIEDNDDR